MPRLGKLITALLLGVALVPTAGLVWVKDSLATPQYCSSCHADPYYTAWAAGDSTALARQHAELGASCQTCHGRSLGDSLDEITTHVLGNYTVPLMERTFPDTQCYVCHESYAAVIPLTDPARTGAERNPHAGHWGELECGVCHNMHRDSVDYCAGCHNPVTTADGWVSAPRQR